MKALKKAGLIPKTTDLRKVKPTKHYQGLVRKFSGVIRGTHVVAPAPKNAKAYSNTRKGSTGTTRSGNKIIMPKSSKTNATGEYKGWPARIYNDKSGNKIIEIPLPKPWDELFDNPLIQDMEDWDDYGMWDFIVIYEQGGVVKPFIAFDPGMLQDSKLLNSGTVHIRDMFARRVIRKSAAPVKVAKSASAAVNAGRARHSVLEDKLVAEWTSKVKAGGSLDPNAMTPREQKLFLSRRDEVYSLSKSATKPKALKAAPKGSSSRETFDFYADQLVKRWRSAQKAGRSIDVSSMSETEKRLFLARYSDIAG